MRKINMKSTRIKDDGAKGSASMRAILISVLIMTFMMTLDSSILNVALPTMAKTLNVETSQIDWACTAYLISICAFVFVFGKIADVIGKTKVFQIGTMIFTIGSLLCGLSENFVFLIISRLIQGIGASAAMSSNLGIISETYPQKDRAKALSGVSSAVALGTLVGPIAGGAILSYFKWQVIFLINLPVGLIAFVVGMICLPKHNGEKISFGRFDFCGSVLIILAVSAVISALTMLQTYHRVSLYLLLFFGFLLFIVFAAFEKKAKNPLVQVSLFSNKAFMINLLAIAITFTSIGTYNIMMPFYLQNALGYSPGRAGAIMTAQPLIMATIAPIAGILADKYGYRPVSAIGMFVFGCGALFQGLRYQMDTGLFLIILGIIIFAAGNALSQAPNNALVMSSVSPKDYGFAGSCGTLGRHMGISIGLTLSTSVLYVLMSHKAGFPVTTFISDRPELFIYGLRYVMIGTCMILWTASLLMWRAFRKEKIIWAAEERTEQG